MFYRVTRWVLRQLGFAYFRLDVSGLDQIPSRGPAVIAGNHPDILDGILLLVVSPRRVRFLVAEEMFFRGLLYGWLRSRLGVGRGLLLSALLFAVLHANLMAFLPILGLGLLLGWVYEQTGSLAVPAAVHLFHNGGMMALALWVKPFMVSP